MPVNTTETFILIERTATTGESVMVKHLFIQVLQFIRQFIRITILGIKMDSSIAVLLQNRTEVFLHNGQLFCSFRQVIHFQKRLATAVRIEHIRTLIFAIQIRITHRIK